ncbi:ANKRD28 [Symbiodinium natans]|uniref:ANKRD28 protein n=1 Tax=Symbiodinium natans TaxID=878477 RepID=A0A812II03_9DINO|nr:ANKRD28 [Symbiodinium natans]
MWRRTALHYCAFEGNVEVAQALLQAGADPFLRDREERTPLHVAAAMGQVGVARELLGTCVSRIRAAALQRFRRERMEPTEPWEDPSMADQRAAKSAMADYLHALEETRRDLLLSEDKHQFTCLHYAVRDAYSGCFQLLKLLLTSLFEFPKGREIDDIMTSKLFEIPHGPGLMKLLAGYLLEEEVAAIAHQHIKRSQDLSLQIANHRDIQGVTPLHHASAMGNYRAAQVLVAHGADRFAKAILPDAQGAEATGQPPSSATPVDLAKDATTSQALAKGTGQDTVETLVQSAVTQVEAHGQDVNEARGLLARRPLHVVLIGAIASAQSSKSSLVEHLLKEYPECDPCITDANGWTPLHYAAAYGRHAELRMLISQAKRLHPRVWQAVSGKENRARGTTKPKKEAGTSISSTTKTPGSSERRPLSRPGEATPAAQRQGIKAGSSEPEDVEAAGFPSHCWTESSLKVSSLSALMGRTPTHLAAQGAGKEAAALLGDTGHIQCLNVLLETGLLDLTALDDRGLSPLLAACAAGSAAGARWLLLHGADCYAEDKMRRNALHVACSCSLDEGRRELVRFLCRWDADYSRLKSMRDCRGRRPQDIYLYRQGSRRAIARDDALPNDFATLWEAARLGDQRMLRTCLQASPKIDAASPGGFTAAMYAASNGHVDVLRTLLSMRCSCGAAVPESGMPERPDAKWCGRSPLHLAAEAGHADVCSLLVRGGAQLEARSKAGLTPLLSAAAAGQLASLKVLVALRADLEASQEVDNGRRNAFHILAGKRTEPHFACLRWLLDTLLAEDFRKLLQMLELQDSDLRRPVDLAQQRGRSHQALLRTMRQAQEMCDAVPDKGSQAAIPSK